MVKERGPFSVFQGIYLRKLTVQETLAQIVRFSRFRFTCLLVFLKFIVFYTSKLLTPNRCCRKVKESLSCSVEHELSSEAAIVSRLVYRNSTQHKGAVFFGKMKTTFSRLKTFLSQLSKLRGILLESMGRIKLSRLVDLTMLIIKTAVSAKLLACSCEDTYNVSMSQLAQVIYRWEYFVS